LDFLVLFEIRMVPRAASNPLVYQWDALPCQEATDGLCSARETYTIPECKPRSSDKNVAQGASPGINGKTAEPEKAKETDSSLPFVGSR
jgi:hypothetical protein